MYNYRHSRAQRISENLLGVFFTIINLEPKYVEDVVLTALILHNILIKSPNSRNIYSPVSFADCILDGGEIANGEWRANVVLLLIHFTHYKFREREKRIFGCGIGKSKIHGLFCE